VNFVHELEAKYPQRDIAVVIPDLVMNHWYDAMLHNNRGSFLRTLLRMRCSSRIVIIHTSYRIEEDVLPAARAAFE
jgi:hypothetical protein